MIARPFFVRTPLLPVLAALMALAGFAPSAAAQAASAVTPSFVAVDVHVSPVRLHPSLNGSIRGDGLVLKNATLDDLISIAWHVDGEDIYNGPAWIARDRFDINAKTTAKFDDQSVQTLLRGLLADRFHLVAHSDTRPLPAFVLSAGKGNKMKPAADTTDSSGCQYQQAAANTPAQVDIHFVCRNTTMESLADFLHEAASSYLNRPVMDKTGLKGGWDFDLQWTYYKGAGGGTSIFDAVDRQLGLKLEASREPIPVVVIDSVNRQPTPNVAGIENILPPPPPAAFDVAVIRQADPTEKHFNVEVQGRRVTVHFATLQTLIYKSYNIGSNFIQNKPKWLDEVHWDITGTVTDNGIGPQVPGAAADLDDDQINEMVRTLLADRFKLTTHAGSEPATVYALVADNPKMRKAADPSGVPSCKEGPGPDGKDPRIDNPLLDRLVYCQNMTMAEFADELHTLASGYLKAPVVDSTNLPGAYDFTINFSRVGRLTQASAAPTAVAPGVSGEAADPGSGSIVLSLPDAVQKQLGLKFEKRDSVPMPTLVIDHIEPQPTQN